jgi:hypothetical protein
MGKPRRVPEEFDHLLEDISAERGNERQAVEVLAHQLHQNQRRIHLAKSVCVGDTRRLT